MLNSSLSPHRASSSSTLLYLSPHYASLASTRPHEAYIMTCSRKDSAAAAAAAESRPADAADAPPIASIRDEVADAMATAGATLRESRDAGVTVLLVLCPGFFEHDALVDEAAALLTEVREAAASGRVPPHLVCLFSTGVEFDEYLACAPARLKRLGLFEAMFGKWPLSAQLQEVAAEHAVRGLPGDATRSAASRHSRGVWRPRPLSRGSTLQAVKDKRAKVGIEEVVCEGAAGPAPDTYARTVSAAKRTLRGRALSERSCASLLGGGTSGAQSDAKVEGEAPAREAAAEVAPSPCVGVAAETAALPPSESVARRAAERAARARNVRLAGRPESKRAPQLSISRAVSRVRALTVSLASKERNEEPGPSLDSDHV